MDLDFQHIEEVENIADGQVFQQAKVSIDALQEGQLKRQHADGDANAKAEVH